MIIHSPVDHLTFLVSCEDREQEEAEKLVNQLANKLIKEKSLGINRRFTLQELKDYLAVSDTAAKA